MCPATMIVVGRKNEESLPSRNLLPEIVPWSHLVGEQALLHLPLSAANQEQLPRGVGGANSHCFFAGLLLLGE